MMKEALWMMRHWRHQHSPRKIANYWRNELLGWKRFWKSYQNYKKIAGIKGDLLLDSLYPCIGDDTTQTWIEPIYFYQDTWAFEKIIKFKPKHHVDIGSHHKFVAFLSKVLPVTMVDIRPLSLPLDSLKFQEGSILDLPFEDNSIESLSSLCVVEHIGLGRYGDPLDSEGTEKAIRELQRVIQPLGNLYLSVPVDNSNKIYFNAHRAFNENYLLELFSPFKLIESKYIYGSEFVDRLQVGFGVGCYHLRNI